MALRLGTFSKMRSDEENISGRIHEDDYDDHRSSTNRRSVDRSSSNRRSVDRRTSDGRSSPEDYRPSSSSSRRRRSPEDTKPERKPDRRFLGPYGKEDNEVCLRRYPTQVPGYCEDSKEREMMEKMGLPTGFNQGGNMSYTEEETGTVRQRGKKGEKMTYYCEICMIELNSEDTMFSHMKGVKHMKKKIALEQQRNAAQSRGERVTIPKTIIQIDNPEPTKKKVPIRLHEKIKETMDPVIGLRHVKEYIAVSDAEMEPHYECGMCGNQGQANGMFSHIMGHKHRQKFVDIKYGENNPQFINLSQKELLKEAMKYNENVGKISDLIRTRRSDEEYPWPPGKAPWSVEKGGTGIAPDNARENWGKNRIVKTEIEMEEEEMERKPFKRNSRDISPEEVGRCEQRSSGLPSPNSLRKPKNSQEKQRYLHLASEMFRMLLDSSDPSREERVKLEANIDSISVAIGKLVEKSNKRPRSISRTSVSPSTSKRRTISPPIGANTLQRSDSISRGYERRSSHGSQPEQKYNPRSYSPDGRGKRSPPSPARYESRRGDDNNGYERYGRPGDRYDRNIGYR